MKSFLKYFIVTALLGVSSCTYTTSIEEDLPPIEDDLSFVEDIEPIFSTQGCIGCHPSSAGLDLSVGNSFASIMSKSLVDEENSEQSKIYVIPINTGGHYSKYTSTQSQLVITWIEQGAKDN